MEKKNDIKISTYQALHDCPIRFLTILSIALIATLLINPVTSAFILRSDPESPAFSAFFIQETSQKQRLLPDARPISVKRKNFHVTRAIKLVEEQASGLVHSVVNRTSPLEYHKFTKFKWIDVIHLEQFKIQQQFWTCRCDFVLVDGLESLKRSDDSLNRCWLSVTRVTWSVSFFSIAEECNWWTFRPFYGETRKLCELIRFQNRILDVPSIKYIIPKLRNLK